MSRRISGTVANVNPQAFSALTKVRFHQVDSVGIVFFGNVFALAHDAYEDFVQHLGFSLKEWFENPEWAVPIRQSGCEYFRPLMQGDELKIQVTVEKLGENSFSLKYGFYRASDLCCEVRLVHVFMNIKTRVKMPMPSLVRERLETYERQCLNA